MRHRHSRLDAAVLDLVRIVLDPCWTAETGAEELLGFVDHDERLLRMVRARVARNLLTRPTQADRRAGETLELALSRVTPSDQPRGFIPRQTRRELRR